MVNTLAEFIELKTYDYTIAAVISALTSTDTNAMKNEIPYHTELEIFLRLTENFKFQGLQS